MSGNVVAVTGATGYIGRRACAHLAGCGWTVHALVREGSSSEGIEGAAEVHPIGPGISATLRDLSVDAVLHLAAKSARLGEHVSAAELVDSNVRLIATLLQAMRDAGVRRLVNAGSFWQTSGGTHYSPNSLYAATKQAAESLIDYSAIQEGLSAVTLRLPHVYGPDDRRAKLLPRLATLPADSAPEPLSPGEQQVDFVHVNDVSRAFAVALRRTAASVGASGGHEVFWVTSGHILTLRDVVATLGAVRGSEIPVAWGARPYPPGEVMRVSPGAVLPDWRPETPLDVGLRSLVPEAPANG